MTPSTPLTEADAHNPAEQVEPGAKVLHLRTYPDRGRENMLKVLRETIAAVEQGDVRDLVLAYYRADHVLCMRDVLTTGNLTGVGMAENLKHEILTR